MTCDGKCVCGPELAANVNLCRTSLIQVQHE